MDADEILRKGCARLATMLVEGIDLDDDAWHTNRNNIGDLLATDPGLRALVEYVWKHGEGDEAFAALKEFTDGR